MASSSHGIAGSPTVSSSPGHQAFVSEPDRAVLQDTIWESSVLIPASAPDSHAFLGPLPKSLQDLEEVRTQFPGSMSSRPRAFIRGPYTMDFMENPSRVFRTSPPIGNQAYFSWLNKVESKKGTLWRRQGIFDLIQLSRLGLCSGLGLRTDPSHIKVRFGPYHPGWSDPDPLHAGWSGFVAFPVNGEDRITEDLTALCHSVNSI